MAFYLVTHINLHLSGPTYEITGSQAFVVIKINGPESFLKMQIPSEWVDGTPAPCYWNLVQGEQQQQHPLVAW